MSGSTYNVLIKYEIFIEKKGDRHMFKIRNFQDSDNVKIVEELGPFR